MGCAPSAPPAATPEVVVRPKCRYSSACVDVSLQHRARFAHPGDPELPPRAACGWGAACGLRLAPDHIGAFAHPGDPDYVIPPGGLRHPSASSGSRQAHGAAAAAERGAPEPAAPPEPVNAPRGPRQACKFGLRCWRTSCDHTVQYSHPGDTDYRRGRVLFKDGVEPEFGTLRQLFDFCDPDGHGNFTCKQDLQQALLLLAKHWTFMPLDVDRAWREMDGERDAHAGFAKFAAWVQEAGAPLPVGVELTLAESDHNHLSCGFEFPGGRRCDCRHFCAAAGGAGPLGGSASQFCKCGHKRSMHAMRPKDGERAAAAALAPSPSYWRPSLPKDGSGMSSVELDGDAKARFQFLFDMTHKAADNWTRDRGCSLHGLACRSDCAFRHKRPVPTGYRVEAVVRNMNAELWGLYAVHRAAIAQECEGAVHGEPFRAITDIKTVEVLLEDAPLVESCNEWFLLHGSRPSQCRSICEQGFSLSRAGTGATWKDEGASTGLPLYGYGLYFAESITKADEYSEAVPDDEPLAGCHSVLVCRVAGGRAQTCDTDKIDPAFLQKQVIAGPFHSVLGDRVTKLGKPYREMVVYDATQCYPEYIVYYRRLYG